MSAFEIVNTKENYTRIVGIVSLVYCFTKCGWLSSPRLGLKWNPS